MSQSENTLLLNKNILICYEILNLDELHNNELNNIKNNFCGIVYNNNLNINTNNCIIYACGDISTISNSIFTEFNVIKELSYNYTNKHNLINIGEIPININYGIYFKHFFKPNQDYFNLITKEHTLQELTESNKQSKSYRNGIYLTNVEKINEDISFNLLRCSTNFSGPSENFKTTDNTIITKVNNISNTLFKEPIIFNHVLVQIYNNLINNEFKEKKAKIKQHSDKTKDMPKNSLIAFCTFYDNINQFKKSNTDLYDLCYKKQSVLTKLHFKLKKSVKSNLKKEFTITLYPNSLFIINLTINRLYTHEIIPSTLPIDKIPTRIGYIIRCSETKAIYKDKDKQVFINNKKLEKITDNNMKCLKDLYRKENSSDEFIIYPEIYFSMNDGDYLKPII